LNCLTIGGERERVVRDPTDANLFLPPPRGWRMGIEESEVDPATFLEDVEMRVGEVVSAEPFPAARKDLYRLEVDFGTETRQSAAGLTDNYAPGDLVGRQVLAVVNLGSVVVAGYESQCLVTGVDDGDGGVVHLQPEREVPNGQRVY
jgi:tRNA-binding protein